MEQEKRLTGKIVLYQPDETIRLEVRMDDETVWLTQAQMAELFDKTPQNVTMHIRNAYEEGEIEKESTCKEYLQVQVEGKRKVKRIQKFYNLDVIISVGYRVKSHRGTEFRRWATKVLKEYLLQGYAVNQNMHGIRQQLCYQDKRISQLEEKVDFFVQTSLPPRQGVFFDGQIFDAYRFVSDLVRKADRRIVLIDNYVDDTVLALLDKRRKGVSATIYTKSITDQFLLDITRHNEQYTPIEVKQINKAHDRFLIIDDEVYHIGASIKDLGKKWFAFALMNDLVADNFLEMLNLVIDKSR